MVGIVDSELVGMLKCAYNIQKPLVHLSIDIHTFISISEYQLIVYLKWKQCEISFCIGKRDRKYKN